MSGRLQISEISDVPLCILNCGDLERLDKKNKKKNKVRLSSVRVGKKVQGLFDHPQPSLITGVLALKELKTKIGSWPGPQ